MWWSPSRPKRRRPRRPAMRRVKAPEYRPNPPIRHTRPSSADRPPDLRTCRGRLRRSAPKINRHVRDRRRRHDFASAVIIATGWVPVSLSSNKLNITAQLGVMYVMCSPAEPPPPQQHSSPLASSRRTFDHLPPAPEHLIAANHRVQPIARSTKPTPNQENSRAPTRCGRGGTIYRGPVGSLDYRRKVGSLAVVRVHFRLNNDLPVPAGPDGSAVRWPHGTELESRHQTRYREASAVRDAAGRRQLRGHV